MKWDRKGDAFNLVTAYNGIIGRSESDTFCEERSDDVV